MILTTVVVVVIIHPSLQVKDYTINFWCVLPTFFPKLAPAQNPVAEGMFNVLLAWAALFSGFLPDGRTSKKVRK